MILNIVLSIFLLLCLFIIVNLLRKLERIDDETNDIALYVEDLHADIQKLQKDMNEIDSKQIFQSDDEVGTIFTELKNIIDRINEKYPEDINE